MIVRPTDLPAIDPKTGMVNAIVETSKHARAKLDYDPESGFYKVHDTLPEGLTFPFNFGFIPSTLAEDGDPLDVLIISDAEYPCGCLLAVRLLGIIEAEETEGSGSGREKPKRNDRLISVSAGDPATTSLRAIDDLRREFVDQIARFFKIYGEFKGKQWRTLGRSGPDRALEVLEQAGERRREHDRKAR